MSAEVDELVSPVASLAAASVGVARKARLEAESALAASGEGDGEDDLDDERRGAVPPGAGRTTWEAGFVRPGGGGSCPCVAVRDACSPRPEAPVFLVDLVLVAISSVLNVAFAVPTAALTLVARSLAWPWACRRPHGHGHCRRGGGCRWTRSERRRGAGALERLRHRVGRLRRHGRHDLDGCGRTEGMAGCVTWVVAGEVTGVVTGGLTGGGGSRGGLRGWTGVVAVGTERVPVTVGVVMVGVDAVGVETVGAVAVGVDAVVPVGVVSVGRLTVGVVSVGVVAAPPPAVKAEAASTPNTSKAPNPTSMRTRRNISGESVPPPADEDKQRSASRNRDSAVAQPKHRIAGRDAPQLLVRRVCADALEEDADLGLPPLQICPQQPWLLVILELGCGTARGGVRAGACPPRRSRAGSAPTASRPAAPRGSGRPRP